MQYSIVGNDIALIMHYHALLKRSDMYILVDLSVPKKLTQLSRKMDHSILIIT